MKIAFIIEQLNPFSSSRAPIEMALRLNRKHDITLYAHRQHANLECQNMLIQAGIKVILIHPFPIPLVNKCLSSINLYLSLIKHKPEVISFHSTLPFFLAAKLSRIPIVKTYYGLQLDAYLERYLPGHKPTVLSRLFNWIGNQYVLLLEKVQLGSATKVVGISAYTAKEAARISGRLTDHIYLGGDYPSLADAKPTTKHCRQTTNLLSVSRFTPYKGFHRLIKAFIALRHQFPNTRLTLIGSDQKNKYFKYLNRIKNDQVRILYHITDRGLVTRYHECDIYLTADRFLFFGLPVVEAAYFGKPTVALNFAAAGEVIQHQSTGFVADNIKEFTGYLADLVQNRKLRQDMGKKARAYAVRQFNWTKACRQYEQIFKQCQRRFKG